MVLKTETVKRKILRGSILELLYNTDRPTLVRTIELVLQSAMGDVHEEMLMCINYLLDRGYVCVWKDSEEDKSPDFDVMLRITDKGQDVVENTVKDAGVLFPSVDGR